MRKKQVLEILPRLKELKKELKADQRALGELNEKVIRNESIVTNLDGVTLHQDFPVRVYEPEGGDTVEVTAGCDEVSRYAVVSFLADGSGQVRVTAYKEEGDTEGKPLAEGVTSRIGLRVAKDYVATGQIGRPKAKAETPKAAPVKVRAKRKAKPEAA